MPSTPDTTGSSDAWVPRLIVLTSMCLLLTAVLRGTPLQSANDRSRWATVWSLVHQNTWQIDEIDQDPRWSTIDKVRHRVSEDAPYHFYSSKPPLLSAIAAGLYAVQRSVFGADLRSQSTDVTRWLLVILNVVPMGLALWHFQRTIWKLNVSLLTQCFVLSLAGVGSMLNPYLSTLNNHTPAAISVLISLSLIVSLQQQRPDERRGRDFALVGFTAALATCFELPAAFFGLVTFVWMLTLGGFRAFRWYVPAALIPLTAFFVSNWLVTGGVKPFYAYYGTDKYVYVHNGIPSYWMDPQGLDANEENPLVYLLHCLIGHHGLLSHTPAFLLTIGGWLFWNRTSRSGLRWVLPAGAGLSIAVLGFYLTRTQNYNYGGNSVALRWMLWLTPFWWFAMLEPLDWLLRRTAGRIICGLMLAASVATAAMSLSQPWSPSWIYQAMSQAGWIDYRTPVAPFDSSRYSVFASWPEESGTEMTWRLEAAEDASISVRSLGHRTHRGQRVCSLQLVIRQHLAHKDSREGNTEIAESVLVLLDAFEAGKPVEDWLFVEDSSGGLQNPPGWLIELVRGMPSDRAYAPSGIRWHQKSGASTAYRCQRAASRVSVQDPRLGWCSHRCDVWYCEDVPFGVLKWTVTVTRADTGEILHVKTWLAENLP